jgi:hypothetical protein
LPGGLKGEIPHAGEKTGAVSIAVKITNVG